jgi:tRNA dimethylallyltransferase
MLSNGLVEEVEGILNSHPSLDQSYSSLRAVGYKQTYYYLKGKLPKEDLRDKIVFATRQLAKRQITWMRKMQNLRLFDPFQENLQTQVKESINTFLDKH